MAKLIEIRNEILNGITEIKKIFNSAAFYGNYNKKDMTIMLQISHDLRNTEHMRIHSLWDIPKKTHNNEYYENGKLTE